MGLISKSRKGNVILESWLLILVFVIFGIITVFGYKTFTELNTELQADIDVSPEAKNITSNLHSRFPSVLDGGFVFMLGLMWILVVAASFRIDTHPMFFILSVILLLAMLFVAASLSNAYQELSEDPELQSSFDKFPMMNFIINNLVKVILVMGFSVLIVLFGKRKLFE